MAKTLYIAYGSNLNLEQMALRCPTARPIGAAKLNGYQLLFRGGNKGAVATVEKRKGGIVPVLAWEIETADEKALDRYEGYPNFYRKEYKKVRLNGKWTEVMVYIMNDGRPLGEPSKVYYNCILEGYKSAGFDEAVLGAAFEISVKKERHETGAKITDECFKQIMAVRKGAKVNMFDRISVQREAYERGFYELVLYIEENPTDYCNFILEGRKQ